MAQRIRKCKREAYNKFIISQNKAADMLELWDDEAQRSIGREIVEVLDKYTLDEVIAGMKQIEDTLEPDSKKRHCVGVYIRHISKQVKINSRNDELRKGQAQMEK